MKNVFTALASGALALGLTTAAFAQTETALAYATRTKACNDLPVISARYLTSGQLEVTCPPGAVTGATGAAAAGATTGAGATGAGAAAGAGAAGGAGAAAGGVLAGTGLGVGATIGLVSAVAVLGIASGGSGGIATTTTTTGN